MLYLFDLDCTLTQLWSTAIFPGVAARLNELARAGHTLVVTTNQGGIGYRYAYDYLGQLHLAARYPNGSAVLSRLATVSLALPMIAHFYVAAHSGHPDWPRDPGWGDRIITGPNPLGGTALVSMSWHADWRKPAPGMLRQAIRDYDFALSNVRVIGDSTADQEAATHLALSFAPTAAFFVSAPPGV